MIKVCIRCDRANKSRYTEYCHPCYTRVWKDKNREKAQKHCLDYNRRTEYASYKDWVRRNPQAIKNRDKKRNNLVKLATPKWADLKRIREFYKNKPKGMEVDHIIPINNPLVCGLHVLNNLRYVTPDQNKRKYNKLLQNIINDGQNSIEIPKEEK